MSWYCAATSACILSIPVHTWKHLTGKQMRQVRFNYWAINTGPQLPFVRIDNIVVVSQWHQSDQQQQQQIIFWNKIFETK